MDSKNVIASAERYTLPVFCALFLQKNMIKEQLIAKDVRIRTQSLLPLSDRSSRWYDVAHGKCMLTRRNPAPHGCRIPPSPSWSYEPNFGSPVPPVICTA